MRRIRIVGLALVAVCAMSVTATAGASAHDFKASAAGKLTSKALATQKFKTAAGLVECTALHLTSGTAALLSETQTATVQYTGCKAFGLAATVSPAQYEFNANGSVKLLATITITATECTVTVPSAKNTKLSTIKYTNSNKQIVLEPSVNNITSSGAGAGCKYAEESLGTYTGNSVVGLESGGTLTWQ
jgi:hypothetical protein